MFVGLKKPLEKASTSRPRLTFAKAGKVEVDFIVEGIGAMHGGKHAMPAMSGDHAMPGMKH